MYETLAKPIYGLATGTAIFCVIVLLINLHIKKTAMKTMVSREFGSNIESLSCYFKKFFDQNQTTAKENKTTTNLSATLQRKSFQNGSDKSSQRRRVRKYINKLHIYFQRSLISNVCLLLQPRCDNFLCFFSHLATQFLLHFCTTIDWLSWRSVSALRF